jgi:hypothetical protein
VNTPLLTRDILMKAAYGTLLTGTLKNGQLWTGVRMAGGNIQGLLNSITDIPGSILFRNATAWVGLPPGSADQVLGLSEDGITPEWVDNYTPPNSGITRSYPTATAAPSQSATLEATKGNIIEPSIDIEISHIRFAALTVTGHTYRVSMVSLNAARSQIAAVLQTVNYVEAAGATKWVDVDILQVLTAGTQYAILVTDTSLASGGTAFTAVTAASAIPIYAELPDDIAIAKTASLCPQIATLNPVTGTTVTTATAALQMAIDWKLVS